jgi:hypothetical protein
MSDPYDRQQTAVAMSERPEPPAQPEASALARHGDPSLQRRKTDGAYASPKDRRPGGIEWVRASDLLTRGGIRAADRGANSQENLVRRMRGGMASINPASRRGVARRSANSLPPPSAFGATPPSQPTVQPGAVSR